jgi:ribosomal protein S18 acetylase RimI-like enzyme
MTATLAHAKANGIRAARVDWTHLIDWYEKLGFEVERRFTPMRLDLTDPN